jgi:uncharacterized membrane protein
MAGFCYNINNMEIKIFYTILHIFGAIIGAGGAYMSDVMFMLSISDNKINHTEYKFLQAGSFFVWFGIIISIISGALLFSINPTFYLQSDKFLAKMTIFIALVINGIFFHKLHMPIIHAHKDKEFNKVKKLKKERSWLLYSGVISMVSWTFAVVLGAWRNIPYVYGEIITAYVILVLLGSIFGRIFFHKKFSL